MTPLIAVHAMLATMALLAGGVALWARRPGACRPAWHRAAGRLFVCCIAAAAGTAVFIRSTRLPNWHGFSPVHLLIPLTVAGIARALWQLKRHNTAGHRQTMRMVYLGACVLAGLFTLWPSRLIGGWLWSSLGLI